MSTAGEIAMRSAAYEKHMNSLADKVNLFLVSPLTRHLFILADCELISLECKIMANKARDEIDEILSRRRK